MPLDVFVIIFAGIIGFVVPGIIVNVRQHKNKTAILVLALLTGWTFIGFVVAVVWSLTDNVRKGDDRLLRKHGLGESTTVGEWNSLSEDMQLQIINLGRGRKIKLFISFFLLLLFSVPFSILTSGPSPGPITTVGVLSSLILALAAGVYGLISYISYSRSVKDVWERARSLDK